MSLSAVQVTASSRLHFGMFAFGQPKARQFGGVGAMISQPGLELRISPADHFAAFGPLSHRAVAVVERYSRHKKLSALPKCRVEIVSAPDEHLGLGTGTQFALALVAGLNAFGGGESLDPCELAMLAGRGARSAVGTYGFAQGGLVFDRGKLAGDSLSPLGGRVELPDAWRFVLICPLGEWGLSGDDESAAIGSLPPVAPEVTARLMNDIECGLLPSAAAGQFQSFSDSLYRYGHEAGQCFAAKQGGAFASPRIAELVATIRKLGVAGVGQSSWGPTVFALLESAADAQDFVERIRPQIDRQDTVIIAEPKNSGARIVRRESI